MLLAGRPLRAEAALAAGLVSAVVPEAELDAYGEALAADMLKARPDALRLTKRTLDAALESPSLEVAYELEERAQMRSDRAPVNASPVLVIAASLRPQRIAPQVAA